MGMRGPGAGRLKAAQSPANHNDEAFLWRDDRLTRAGRVVAFLESLPITKGKFAGTKMKVRPWQREIVEAIYATDDAGKRRVRTALITMPRKNGKTGIAAGLCLAHLIGPEAEVRGECYSCAADRNQAGIIFAEMEAIILQTPWMAERMNVQRFHKRIEDKESGSIYQALSADARKAHGLNVSFFIYDEMAQAPNRNLFDFMTTGMGGREEPLGIVISTQSADPLHIMSEVVDYGLQVQEGIIDDPTFHGTIYSAPEDSDPWAEETWHACNPALADFRSLEEMRQFAAKAQRIPSLEATFRNLYLNQRVDAEERFINASEWDACSASVDMDALRGRRCFGGLDLGSVRDLTALTLVFPDDSGGYDVLVWFWCPKDSLRAREDVDKVPYLTWAAEGLIEPTPGAATDFSFPVHRLGELATMFDIQAIAYDRWRIEDFRRSLSDESLDLKLEPFGQGFKDMAPAVDYLETLILGRNLRHGGNAILRWNASNAVVTRDAAGNRKLDKERCREKIDGLVALAMALGLAKRYEEETLPACLMEFLE